MIKQSSFNLVLSSNIILLPVEYLQNLAQTMEPYPLGFHLKCIPLIWLQLLKEGEAKFDIRGPATLSLQTFSLQGDLPSLGAALEISIPLVDMN